VDCYSVSPHDFYIFLKLFLSIFFFNIELVDNYNCSFPHKTLWIVYSISLHESFFFFFFYNFFQNCLCCFYVFNIKLVENLALYFFSLKHCGLLQSFPTWFFLLCFFKKLFLSILFFKYWAGWKLQLYISSQNTIDCYSVSLYGFFPFIFFNVFF